MAAANIISTGCKYSKTMLSGHWNKWTLAFWQTELHTQLNVEWRDVYRKRLTCAVYKLVNSIGPPSLCNLFERVIPTKESCSRKSLWSWNNWLQSPRLQRIILYFVQSGTGHKYHLIFSTPSGLNHSNHIWRNVRTCSNISPKAPQSLLTDWPTALCQTKMALTRH